MDLHFLPQGCGANEEYKVCGPFPTEQCNFKAEIVPDRCEQGCLCKKGYVRKAYKEQCILKSECPGKCILEYLTICYVLHFLTFYIIYHFSFILKCI